MNSPIMKITSDYILFDHSLNRENDELIVGEWNDANRVNTGKSPFVTVSAAKEIIAGNDLSFVERTEVITAFTKIAKDLLTHGRINEADELAEKLDNSPLLHSAITKGVKTYLQEAQDAIGQDYTAYSRVAEFVRAVTDATDCPALSKITGKTDIVRLTDAPGLTVTQMEELVDAAAHNKDVQSAIRSNVARRIQVEDLRP